MHPILAIRAFFQALFGQTKTPVPAHSLPMREDTKPMDPLPTVSTEGAAAQVLATLQREGRFVDFLFEDIDGFSDADVGAAAREVHRGCKKALTDHFDLAAIRSEEEDQTVEVPKGYNCAEVKLVGQVTGQGPFSGNLKHKGWRAKQVRLPRIPTGTDALVIAPAEVEIT